MNDENLKRLSDRTIY